MWANMGLQDSFKSQRIINTWILVFLYHKNHFCSTGREAHEEVNITFTLPTAWSADDCALHGHCEQVVFTACMTLTANPGVFPVTV